MPNVYFVMPSSDPEPGVFKSWVSGAERFGQYEAYFNSKLAPLNGVRGNATLTIYLRLYLLKCDRAQDIVPRATTDEGLEIEVVPWGTPTGTGKAYDFAEFTRGVKEEAEKFWDNTNLCLVPPPDYRGLEYSLDDQKVRPNIDCRFKIVWASGKQDAHAVIYCFCPKISFRSNSDHWTCYDLVAHPGYAIPGGAECETNIGPRGEFAPGTTYRCNKEIAHEAVCHEVGHLLGLAHVGKFFTTPACLKGADPTNGPDCYIGPTYSDTENIMGQGDKIALWNIMPWASRAISHTGIGLQGWRASLRKLLPLRL